MSNGAMFLPMQPEITVSLVAELIAEQFPKWTHLPIRPVKTSGWDNRTFHLGEEMSVRLPSAERYAAQIHKEQEWLPKLAPHLSYSVPEPIAMGQPSRQYPWNWSVYRWIDGESADSLHQKDFDRFAADCAQFLNEFYKIDITGGPIAGPHNFFRGGALSVYDTETRAAISQLENVIDAPAAIQLWEEAIRTTWPCDPVWVHGDFSAGNILVKEDRLAAVIDFGSMGVGDPACDLVIAWTFHTEESRKIFISGMNMDADTWNRARGWCFWKALITLAALEDKNGNEANKQRTIIETVIGN